MPYPSARTDAEIATLCSMMSRYKKDVPRSNERAAEMELILGEFFDKHPYEGPAEGKKAVEKVCPTLLHRTLLILILILS